MIPPTPARDERVRDYLLPMRVLWESASGVGDARALLIDGDNVCRMKRSGEESPALLLDFGRELHGGVRIDVPITSTGKPARIRLRFGESASEAMHTPNNDHSIHDCEVLVPWMGHQEYGNTAFRFVRIDLLEEEAEVSFRHVKAVYVHRDLPYLGSFECSDPLLEEIWRTSAHTVHLCMQDFVWDAPKRDRLVWLGDMHPETMVISTVFGHQKVVEQSMDYVRDRTPLPGWMNGISSYSIWWIINQHDWYQFHGNLDYLAEQKQYLLGLTRLLVEKVDSDGCEKLDGWRFLEWNTAEDQTAINAGLQALLVIGLENAARLCEVLGEAETAGLARAAEERARACQREASARKQVNALRVLAGMADADQVNCDILSRDFDRDISPFYGFYVLQARSMAGDWQGCLDLLRRYWGGMLAMGATSFWESFNVEWMENSTRVDELPEPGKRDIHADFGEHCYKGYRHSFCHGWAGGPAAWLSQEVLGVKPVEPRYATASVQPRLADLEWARGTVPTPHGLISVRHEKQRGRTVSDVRVPPGVTLVNSNVQCVEPADSGA